MDSAKSPFLNTFLLKIQSFKVAKEENCSSPYDLVLLIETKVINCFVSEIVYIDVIDLKNCCNNGYNLEITFAFIGLLS